MVIDEQLLNQVSAQAKASPRLRMRSACRFACQRIITFISRWRKNVIVFSTLLNQELLFLSIGTQPRMRHLLF